MTGRILAVLALLLLFAGAVLATVARPTETVTVSTETASTETASGAASPAPLLVTAPGVLASRPGPVVVSALGEGAVLVAVGPADDVAAWARDAATTTVTGLAGAEGLATSAVAGEAQVPDPAGSDLWAAQSRGQGGAEVTVDAADAAGWAALVASDGTAPAPDLRLTWTQRPVPLTAWGLVGAGGLLAVVTLAVRPPRALSRRRRREGARAGVPAVVDLRDDASLRPRDRPRDRVRDRLGSPR